MTSTKRLAPAETPLRRHIADFFENRIAVAALFAFATAVTVALLAPWISPQNPYDLGQISILDARLAPGTVGSSGLVYWLGTDDQGRDLLSAILYGLRISLLVGGASVIIALSLGMTLGLASAYFGGRADSMFMRVVDLQLSCPALLIALILIAMVGRGIDKVIVAIVIAQWAFYARTVRGTALVEMRKEYIEAARCLALGKARIIFRHLLPNCLPPVIVVAMIQVAAAISLEATLSFLGVGLPITQPSLGLLIANGYQYMLSGRYWISFFPGIALLILILSINLVGDHLREILNPRLIR
jgi:peptide/nickel transport system permease protein